MRRRTYYVYILASRTRVFYVGVTSALVRRMYQHRHKLIAGFTRKYNVDRLVYFEETNDVRVALEREKEVKRWRRPRKIHAIESMNPEWKDLSAGWF
jgi:putative endonuclease